MTVIALDALGGDHAPGAPVEAAISAAKTAGTKILLVGPTKQIAELLGEASDDSAIGIVDAQEMITVGEQPVQALKKKQNSSIAVGLSLVKSGQADAFVSAGSTGALLAGGLLVLGRIRRINRPALTAILPSANARPFLLLDVGANTSVKPANLVQFAHMGSLYAENVLQISSPRVGLLNIGTEETKGPEHYKQAYELLSNTGIRFVGNVEARDIFAHHADVLVCDGFVGNVVLKTIEGVAGTMFGMLKAQVSLDTRSRLGGLLLKPYLKQMAKTFDYSEYGGVPLLGLNGALIKCHGSSNATALRNGIEVALRYVRSGVTRLISDAGTGERSVQE